MQDDTIGMTFRDYWKFQEASYSGDTDAEQRPAGNGELTWPCGLKIKGQFTANSYSAQVTFPSGYTVLRTDVPF